MRGMGETDPLFRTSLQWMIAAPSVVTNVAIEDRIKS